MIKNHDYVQLVISSNNPKYNGMVATMPLEDFGSVLSHMEKNKLRAHFAPIQQSEPLFEANKHHPISEF